jgi:hypothetical protein
MISTGQTRIDDEVRGSRQVAHSTSGDTLADILERVLDKGVVIAGDIKIKLVDIELLTIQIRLLICSVDKAKELGMDWWARNSEFCSRSAQTAQPTPESAPAPTDK